MAGEQLDNAFVFDSGDREATMKQRHWAGTWPALFTLAVVLLVSVAAAEGQFVFNLVVVGVAALGVGFFYTVFPGSRLFAVALANALAFYTCIYTVMLRANFPTVDPIVFSVFFVLPLIAFLLGALRRKDEIRAIIADEKVPDERKFGDGMR